MRKVIKGLALNALPFAITCSPTPIGKSPDPFAKRTICRPRNTPQYFGLFVVFVNENNRGCPCPVFSLC